MPAHAPQTVSPLAHGFRTAARRPALVLAEAAWRLAFAVAAGGLMAATLAVFLENLRVSESDAMALRSGLWLLVLDALVRIFSESYVQLVRAALVLAPSLAALWMFTAAFARGAVLRPLLASHGRRWMAALLGLHLLRVALGLAALLAFYGSVIFAWEMAATPDGDRLPEVFLRVLPPLLVLVLICWSLLAWLLWLAAIPAAAGRDAFGAIAHALRTWRAHPLEFLRAGLLFSLIRGVAFAAVALLLFALAVQGAETPRPAAALAAALLLAYMLAASWLRVARLAAFAAIFQPPPVAPSASPASDTFA